MLSCTTSTTNTNTNTSKNNNIEVPGNNAVRVLIDSMKIFKVNECEKFSINVASDVAVC